MPTPTSRSTRAPGESVSPGRVSLGLCASTNCGQPAADISPVTGNLLCMDCCDGLHGIYGRSRFDGFFGFLRKLLRIKS